MPTVWLCERKAAAVVAATAAGAPIAAVPAQEHPPTAELSRLPPHCLILAAGMKEFSQWPTFPQVYIGGEFYGGAGGHSSVCLSAVVCQCWGSLFSIPRLFPHYPASVSPNTTPLHPTCADIMIASYTSGELSETLEVVVNS